mmetsp:Transcript_39496/g.63184  ORF Transcript_39496/g.63184 Transcript_39496/m.63184 type:complete len:123 (+) Transcript_39496:810-1178(+)
MIYLVSAYADGHDDERVAANANRVWISSSTLISCREAASTSNENAKRMHEIEKTKKNATWSTTEVVSGDDVAAPVAAAGRDSHGQPPLLFLGPHRSLSPAQNPVAHANIYTNETADICSFHH